MEPDRERPQRPTAGGAAYKRWSPSVDNGRHVQTPPLVGPVPWEETMTPDELDRVAELYARNFDIEPVAAVN